MRKQAGFTLIELIACIVILGFIAVGATTIITLGASSFFSARNVDNAGTSAQLALERMALELRDVNGGPGAGGAVRVLTGPTRIIYTVDTTAQPALTGTRTLTFTGGAITLTPSNGIARTLISGVSTCTMSFSGTGATSTLTVAFTLQDAPKGSTFTITVKPRSNTVTPVTT
jgi:prepilin-type N-terminal cleavage/methylation domain-containing protein